MSNKPVLVVLALLALAAAGWFFLGSGDVALRPDPTAPAVPGPADTAHDRAVPAAATADSGSMPAVATAEQRTEVEKANLDAGGGARDGAATLRGRLVDRSGGPRAGVELAAHTWALPDGLDAIPLPPMHRAAMGAGGTVRTDRDGRFTFRFARDRAGSLELVADDLVFAQDDVVFDMRKGDHDLGDVRTYAASTIRGVVRDAAGRGVADVKVAAFHHGIAIGSRSETTTGDDGGFTLGKMTPGSWTLRTASSRFLPATAPVLLAPEEQKDGVELRVEQGSAVAGIVVDDRGVPVAGMHVGSKRKEARDGTTVERFTPGEATTTDANGYFTLAGLAGATVSLRVYGKGHAPHVESGVAVGTGNLVLRVDRVGIVTGVLRDGAGQPIAGSTVRAFRNQAGGEVGADGDLVLPGLDSGVTTAADGSYAIENVAPGLVRVEAEGRGHRPARRDGVRVLAGQTSSGIDLVADPGAVLRARVTDDQGAPVAGAAVIVRQPVAAQAEAGGPFAAAGRRVRVGAAPAGGAVFLGAEPEPVGKGTTDADGRVEIAGLPTGAVTAVATHDGHAPSRAADATLPAVGGTDVELVLRRPGHVALQTFASDGTATAAEYVLRGPLGPGESSEERSGTTDAAGAARVGPLAPGDYEAELIHEARPQTLGGGLFVGGPERPVAGTRVPFVVRSGESTELALRLPVLTTVRGIVTGAEGPVAGVEIELESTGGGPMDPPPMFEAPRATSGRDGAYAIENVEPGSYRIRWGKKSQVAKAAADLEVPANVPELRHDLELRYGRLEVRVVDAATGRGIAGAEVTLTENRSGGTTRTTRRVMMVATVAGGGAPGGAESTTMTFDSPRALTDADGLATIEDVPPGTWNANVKHDAYAPGLLPQQVVAERETTRGGTLQLAPAGRVRGTVLAADGQPAGMAMVLHHPAGESREPDRQIALNGAFSIDGLKPGRHVLRAQALAGMPGQPPGGTGPEVEVEIEAGKPASVELRLPAR